MKRALYLLICLLLLALPALAEEAATVTLLTPDGLTVTHVVNHDPSLTESDAELLVQHYCTLGEYDLAFALNQQLADLGDTGAIYRLGCQYLSGLGIAQDEAAAIECFTRAKEAGSAEATLAICLARLNGWGMPQDTIGAVAELTAYAQQGQFRHELALLYLHGAYDVPAHEATALHWFDRIQADLLSAIRHYSSIGAEELAQARQQQYDEAIADFRQSDPEDLFSYPPVQLESWAYTAAQARIGFRLGQLWEEGRAGRTDMQAAAHWYEFTTTLRHEPQTSRAYACLAEMHLSGALGEIDVSAAAECFLLDVYDGGYGAYRVGMMYWDGVTGADGTVHLSPDTETALSFLEQAAESGEPNACKLLGDAYRTGGRVKTDVQRAARYYARGLNNTEDEGCYWPLLEMLREGLLYDRAVLDGIWQHLRYWRGQDHQLVIQLAEVLMNGVTGADGTVLVAQDRKAACELMETFHTVHQQLHTEQDVYFLNWLGWFYSGNAPEAVQRNYPKALAYYTESADAGNGYAMAMVGVFYQNGRGVPVNHMTARAWYKKALAAGYTSAQGYLDALNAAYPEYPVDQAVTITTQDGLTLQHVVNPSVYQWSDAELIMQQYCLEDAWDKALEINRQLAEMGDVEAMCRLGRHYAGGLGVAQDDAQAITWLRNAADAGSDGGVFTLACMYLNGWGVKQDAARAAEMLDSLSGDGAVSTELQFMLSTLYRHGWGDLAADAEKARQYFSLSTQGLQAYLRYYSNPSWNNTQRDTRQREYDARLSAFESSQAPDVRLTTRPEPMLSDWTATTAATGYYELGRLWQEGRAGQADLAEAVRWYERLLAEYPESTKAQHPLAVIYRDSLLGYCDVNRAITLFCDAGETGEVAAMFERGVNGPDGQVCLAPNAIIAEAFRKWEATPGDPDAGRRLGDLFRDGSILTANPNLAAHFYWGASASQTCIDQLTALITAGLVTDEEVLYRIVTGAAAVQTDGSALITALAEGVLNGTIAPDGVLGQADALRVTREMLQRAADAGKLDARTAETLLGRLSGE